ncbi:MAG: chemotaxis protein CheW [Treponema sp.]|jgi:purine-binding chemotaxis protein CheW|nr:chemotaxis protein CheW [Treponema sp.]
MPEIPDSETPAGVKYLIFTILGEFFALPSGFIGEIALLDTVYPLPLMPQYVPGIINRYSAPYALIDIGLLLGKTATPRSKVVVLKEQIDKAAFLIDDVIDIVDVQPSDLLQIEQEADPGDITSIVTASLPWNGTNIFVLDIRQILNRVVNDSGS